MIRSACLDEYWRAVCVGVSRHGEFLPKDDKPRRLCLFDLSSRPGQPLPGILREGIWGQMDNIHCDKISFVCALPMPPMTAAPSEDHWNLTRYLKNLKKACVRLTLSDWE